MSLKRYNCRYLKNNEWVTCGREPDDNGQYVRAEEAMGLIDQLRDSIVMLTLELQKEKAKR